MTSIRKLPESTSTRLRSTQIITNISQIISELLQNSLDAGASDIDISIDCEEWMCWVRDNGRGISREGLSQIGKDNDAGRYGKSQLHCIHEVLIQGLDSDFQGVCTPGPRCSIHFWLPRRGFVLSNCPSPRPRTSFSGIALASTADLSCLEISSRTAADDQSWSIIQRVNGLGI